MLMKRDAYVVEVNVDATREAYARRDALTCECADCGNYSRAVMRADPELRLFLATFGIDIRKPVEMRAFATLHETTVQYGGVFLFTGKVLEGLPRFQHIYCESQSIIVGDSAVSFRPVRAGQGKGKGFAGAVVAMEVFMRLPWVMQRNQHG